MKLIPKYLKGTPARKEIIITDFAKDGKISEYDYKLVGNRTYYKKKTDTQWINMSNNKEARANLEHWLKVKEVKLHAATPLKPRGLSTEQLKTLRQHEVLEQWQNNPVIEKIKNETPKTSFDNVVLAPSMYGIHMPMYSLDRRLDGLEDFLAKVKNYFLRHYQTLDEKAPEINYDIPGDFGIKLNGYSLPAQSVDNKQAAQKFNSTLQIVNYDPSTFTYGVRSRGEYPTGVDNVFLTTFFPFYTKNAPILKRYGSFIGVSADGQLKVSTNLDDFEGDGWKISPTFSNIITSFRRNDDGSLYLGFDYKKGTKRAGNPKHRVAYFNGISDDGKIAFDNGLLNILTPREKDGVFATDYYGDIAGGKALFATEDGQMRVFSGSIDLIVKGFEDFQAQNPGLLIRLYTLDNGSYSKVLQRKNGSYSLNEWHNYDMQNNSGGHVVYITGLQRPKLQFASDTAYSLINDSTYRGIARKNDKQVQTGHPLTRSPRGVVLHLTEGHTTQSALEAFRLNGTGANVVIDYNGNRTVLADPSRVTYHAGLSQAKDFTTGEILNNLNDYFSGIEFVGDPTKDNELTLELIASAIEYLRPIILLYNIPPQHLVTHELVRDAYIKAVDAKVPRKIDMNFKSYQQLMKAVLDGIYYKVDAPMQGKAKLVTKKDAKK